MKWEDRKRIFRSKRNLRILLQTVIDTQKQNLWSEIIHTPIIETEHDRIQQSFQQCAVITKKYKK